MADKQTVEKHPGRVSKFLTRWRRKPFIAFYRFVLVTGFVMLLALAGAFYILRGELSNFLAHYLRQKTVDFFNPPVTFTELEINRLGRIVIYDLDIGDPWNRGNKFLHVNRMEIAVNPLTLLREGFTISRVELTDGRVHIYRNQELKKSNVLNLVKSKDNSSNPASKKNGKEGRPFRLKISNVILRNLQVTLDDISDDRIENRVQYIEASLNAYGPEVMLDITHSDISTDYWNFGRARLEGVLPIRNNYLGFQSITIEKDSSEIKGFGFVDFTSREYLFNIENSIIEATNLPPMIAESLDISGMIRANASFSGTFDSTAVFADIGIDIGNVEGYDVSNLSTTIDYAGGILDFDSLSTDIAGGHIDANVRFTFSGPGNGGYMVNADMKNIDMNRTLLPLENSLPDAHLSGRVEFTGQGFVPEKFQFRASARNIRGTIDREPIDSAEVSFNYRNRNLKIDQLEVYSGDAFLTALGDVKKNDLFVFVNVENLDAARLNRFLPQQSAAGDIDFSGSLVGQLDNPILKGALTVIDGRYEKVRFERLEGNCTLNDIIAGLYGNFDLEVDSLQVSGIDFSKVSVKMEIPVDGMILFDPLEAYLDSTNRIYSRGFIDILSGKNEQTIVMDTVALDYRGLSLYSSDIFEIRKKSDLFSINSVTLHTLDGQIHGYAYIYGKDSLDTELAFDSINVETIPSLFGKDIPVEGTLDGRMVFSGSLIDNMFAVDIGVKGAKAYNVDIDTLKAAATMDSKSIEINNIDLFRKGSLSHVSGSIPLRLIDADRDSSLENELAERMVSFHAELDSFPVNGIVNDFVQFNSGKLTGEVDITGSSKDTEIKGQIKIHGGTGVIVPTNTRLNQVNGLIDLTPGRIQLRDIESVSPDGRLNLNGIITLDGLKPASCQLDLLAHDLILQQFKYVSRMKVGAVLTLSGQFPSPVVTGNIRVIDGEFNPVFEQASAESGSAESEAIMIPVMPVDYDIGIRAKDNFLLKNRNTSLKLEAELKAFQTDGVPGVTGSVSTVSGGNYTLYGRRFRVRQGSVQFRGGPQINPTLNISAERTVRGRILRQDLSGVAFIGRSSTSNALTGTGQQYEIDRNTIYLSVTGTLADPIIDITVRDKDERPIEPITRDEALTLLIFDQTYQEFQQQAGISQSKLIDQVANMALSQANPLLQEITGIDDISLETQLFDERTTASDEQTQSSAKLTFGEFLFDTLFFSFSQDLIDPSARSLMIEYLINNKSSLIGQTDSQGHFSVDYRYLIKY